MQDIDADVERQRQQFAGRYVAWLDNQVFLSAETYDELIDRLEQMPVDQRRVSVEYLEPINVVRVY